MRRIRTLTLLSGQRRTRGVEVTRHEPIAKVGVLKVHVFNSSRDRSVFGFTGDRTGENLPTAFAPWYYIDSRKLAPGARVAGVGTSDEVLAAIETDGFYLLGANATRSP